MKTNLHQRKSKIDTS